MASPADPSFSFASASEGVGKDRLQQQGTLASPADPSFSSASASEGVGKDRLQQQDTLAAPAGPVPCSASEFAMPPVLQYELGEYFQGSEDELPELDPGFEWSVGREQGEYQVIATRQETLAPPAGPGVSSACEIGKTASSATEMPEHTEEKSSTSPNCEGEAQQERETDPPDLEPQAGPGLGLFGAFLKETSEEEDLRNEKHQTDSETEESKVEEETEESKVDWGTPDENEQDEVSEEVGKQFGRDHLNSAKEPDDQKQVDNTEFLEPPKSYAHSCIISCGDDLEACLSSLALKCELFAARARELEKSLESRAGPGDYPKRKLICQSIAAPRQAVFVFCFQGHRVSARVHEVLAPYLKNFICKAYFSASEVSTSIAKDWYAQLNTAIQFPVWHGYDLVELAHAEYVLLENDCVETFTSVTEELKDDLVLVLTSVQNKLEGRAVTWATVWNTSGFFEESISTKATVFNLCTMIAHDNTITVAELDLDQLTFGTAAMLAEKGKLRSFPKESTTKSAAQWDANLTDVEKKERASSKANNTGRAAGLPMMRLSSDGEFCFLHKGPCYLAHEGRPSAANPVQYVDFKHELQFRRKGGLGHDYAALAQDRQDIISGCLSRGFVDKSVVVYRLSLLRYVIKFAFVYNLVLDICQIAVIIFLEMGNREFGHIFCLMFSAIADVHL